MRVRLGQPGGEGVDEAVAVVGRVEAQLAPDRRHAEGVAVAADPRDHAAHQRPGLRMRQARRSESAFIAAIGRAPMVKTSRRMPPTPVAAPW